MTKDIQTPRLDALMAQGVITTTENYYVGKAGDGFEVIIG